MQINQINMISFLPSELARFRALFSGIDEQVITPFLSDDLSMEDAGTMIKSQLYRYGIQGHVSFFPDVVSIRLYESGTIIGTMYGLAKKHMIDDKPYFRLVSEIYVGAYEHPDCKGLKEIQSFS